MLSFTPASSRSLLLSCVAIAALCSAACDPSGVADLGEKRDSLVPCEGPTSTWIRSTDEATEIVVVGAADPTALPVEGVPSCFVYGFVAHDSTTHLEPGSYALAPGGKLVTTVSSYFDFEFEPERKLLERRGTYTTRLEAPLRREVAFRKDGTDGKHLLVTLDGTEMRFTNLGTVVESCDASTQTGGEALFRVVNLPLFTSQARLLGFGGKGMTQYSGTAAPFGALVGDSMVGINNYFTVKLDSATKPNAHINYYQFQDLTGVTVAGPQDTFVALSGDGTMAGVLSFTALGTPDPFGVADVTWRGSIDYAQMQIKTGLAAGGTYGFTAIDPVSRTEYTYAIPYTFASNVDLRAVLPVTTP